jgi:hypothetical protein
VSREDDIATLRRLAALKAQRALASLAAARRRADEEAEAIRAADRAMADTFAPPEDGAGWQAQWRLRAALEEARALHVRHHAARDTEARAEEDAARVEVARELGTDALAERLAARRRRDETRRLDRVMGVLSALRKPGGL